MKRELVLPEEAKFWERTKHYPGEYVKIVYGTSRDFRHCDSTGKEIRPGDRCAAISVWTDSLPYHPWEEEYIIPE